MGHCHSSPSASHWSWGQADWNSHWHHSRWHENSSPWTYYGYTQQSWTPPSQAREVITVVSPSTTACSTDVVKETMEVVTKHFEGALHFLGEQLASKSEDQARKIAESTTKEGIIELIEAHMRTGNIFVRVAGLSGALAVCMGAYGAHGMRGADPDKRNVYETANKYHLIHSLALLGVPLTRRPFLVGSLLCSGMLLFSGSCYFYSLTGTDSVRKVTPYGGMLLIAGWFAMAL